MCSVSFVNKSFPEDFVKEVLRVNCCLQVLQLVLQQFFRTFVLGAVDPAGLIHGFQRMECIQDLPSVLVVEHEDVFQRVEH